MINLRKLIAVGFLLLVPFSLKGTHDHHQDCPHHSTFKLEDLKGKYVVQAFTAGGPGEESSADASIYSFRDDGTGVLQSITVRTFNGTPPATLLQMTTPLTALPPTPGTISVDLNPDGTAIIYSYGLPTPADIILIAAVFKKSPETNKITSGYALKIGIIGPSANSASANELKLFNIQRQFE